MARINIENKNGAVKLSINEGNEHYEVFFTEPDNGCNKGNNESNTVDVTYVGLQIEDRLETLLGAGDSKIEFLRMCYGLANKQKGIGPKQVYSPVTKKETIIYPLPFYFGNCKKEDLSDIVNYFCGVFSKKKEWGTQEEDRPILERIN